MKTKGGRDMNPTDAYRKQARKREIKRNRAERHYIREAFNKKTQALTLKEELEELIAIEQNGGELNKLQKLRKKVVMEAYEAAIRRQKEEDLRKRQAEEEGKQLHAGLSSVPLPKPPPLPAGPKPGLPPPPAAAPPLPPGPGPAAAHATGAVLPPPPKPPPGAAAAAVADGSSVPVLPPPPGPPPPAAVLPPPLGPPPAAAAYGMLPPPAGPPPGAWLPPPAMPPPAAAGILPPPAMPPPAAAAAGILPPPAMPPPGAPSSSILPPAPSSTVTAGAGGKAAAGSKAGATTITGASTVAKRPLAHKDKALTSMVPASVLVRREAAAAAAAAAAAGSKPVQIDPSAEVQIGPGFGLAPVQKSAIGSRVGASRLAQQLQQPQEQGKWGSVVQTYVAPAGRAKGSATAAGKPAASVDSKLADFMDSLKDLGAFG